MTPALFATLSALAGAGFGLAYFAALRRTVALFCSKSGSLAPAALTIGRIVAAIVFFGGAAQFGALPLLAALVGFVAARALVIQPMRKAS